MAIKEEGNLRISLGNHESIINDRMLILKSERIIERIWEKDHTVWSSDPAEISNRLGWLHSPEVTMEALEEINAFVQSVKQDEFTHALLLGMGGSSLAPEVFRLTFGVEEGYLDLSVLDSTDPGAVLNYSRKLDPAKTLYIVSTKSGGTVETISFMKYFYTEAVMKVGKSEAGKHFAAVTDPGSGLESMAKELKFRKIFLNDPDIGGRYSALSFFGTVPAALVGINLEELLHRAQEMACSSGDPNCPESRDNSTAKLGAIIGELALKGKDKITFITSPEISSFGTWVEQLIAESTGKNGKGILPVEGESVESPDSYAHDRIFVYLRLNNDNTYSDKVNALKNAGHPVVEIALKDLYDVGGEFFRWEMATVIAGWILGIQPFDQPNVESAKVIAREMVKAYKDEGKLPELTPVLEEKGIKVYSNIKVDSLSETLSSFINQLDEGENGFHGRSYVSIQAYLKSEDKTTGALQNLRNKIHKKFRVATTVGYGPRFLHSTGQLHKGDGGNGLFIQFTADMPEDTPIPDNPGESASSISFGVLKNAQALGDRQALHENGRRFIRFDLGADIINGLNLLTESL